MTSESWRCPLCNQFAESAREHLAETHGVGGNRDRFGLRDAAKRDPRRTSRDDTPAEFGSDETPDPPSESSARSFGPPIWRRVPPAPGRRRPVRPDDGDSLAEDPPLTWRRAPRPPSGPNRRGRTGDPGEAAPQKPVPLPPDAAVLRLVCETMEGVDAQILGDRLRALPGVDSVALDLYARTADLYLDRSRATAPHLVALARERVRLPVRTAELHRSPVRGQGLGATTLIYIVQ
ncbi:MAG: hypothetical protein AB7P40_09760 [Chloroflexota bacterium]